MPLPFIVDTDSDSNATLYVDYTSTTTRDARDLVRNDQVMEFSVEPVTVNAPGDSTIFDADYLSTDTFNLRIGPIDEAPTGGTFSLDVGGTTTNLTGLVYNITAAALQTPLSAAFVTEGESACTVTLLNDGVYQIDATTNGAITTGILTYTASQLQPACEIQVTEVELGDASTPYQLLLVLRQALIATATPNTALTTAGVTATVTQAQSATANKIVTVSMDAARTYGGSFSVSATVDGVTQTCGVATPLMSASEFGLMLAGHPEIFYQNSAGTADNIVVTKNGSSWIVEFTGTQGASSLVKSITDATVANPSILTVASTTGWVSGQTITITNSTGITPSLDGNHVITVINGTTFSIPVNVTVSSGESATAFNATQPALTVTNIDLIAPLGRSGSVNLNTTNLYKYSLAQDTDSFELPIQIQRTRVSGEIRKIFLSTVVLKKEIIDTSTMTDIANILSDDNTFTGNNTFDGATTFNDEVDMATNNIIGIGFLSGDSGGTPLVGTTTNDSASSGFVGQITSSLIATGSAVSLTTNTTANITSISLTAGDWDVEGNVNYNAGSATLTASSAGITSTSATIPSDGSEVASGLQLTTTTAINGITLPRKRMSLSGTTTVYLVARSTFSAGTMAAWGGITARRVR